MVGKAGEGGRNGEGHSITPIVVFGDTPPLSRRTLAGIATPSRWLKPRTRIGGSGAGLEKRSANAVEANPTSATQRIHPSTAEPTLQLRPPATPNHSHHRLHRHEACGWSNDRHPGPSVGTPRGPRPPRPEKRCADQLKRRSKGAAQQATCSSLPALEDPLHCGAHPVLKRSASRTRKQPNHRPVAARCEASRPLRLSLCIGGCPSKRTICTSTGNLCRSSVTAHDRPHRR